MVAFHFEPYSGGGGVSTGSNNEDMKDFKAFMVDTLRTGFGLTLTCASNNFMLSTSKVNVPVLTLCEALYMLGVLLL